MHLAIITYWTFLDYFPDKLYPKSQQITIYSV